MKVAAYARVSSEEQRENQSIEGQIEYIRLHCERMGWEIVGQFLDDGITGDMPFADRPGGRALLAAAARGEFAQVVVFLYDRFSRDVLEGLLAARTLRSHGVMTASCCEPFELGTPHGDFMFIQSLNNSQLWKAQFLQRIRAGIDHWSRQGVWMGGITPFGYVVQGAKKQARLEVDEEPLPGCTLSAAQVVRLLYQCVGVEGRTTFWVADHINALGIPPSYVKDGRSVRRGERTEVTAGVWTPGRVRNIIASSTYKGVHLYGKRSTRERELVERPVPPIVSPELWQAAQDALRRNQITAMRNATRVYLLRGKLVCELCGQVLSGSVVRRKTRTEFFYRCGGKTMYRGVKPGEDPHAHCKGKSVPGVVEEWVWADIERWLHNPGELLVRLQAAQVVGADAREEIEARLVATRKAEASKGAEILRVARMHRTGSYSDAVASAMLQEVQAEQASLQSEVSRLEAALGELQEGAGRLADTEELLTRLRGEYTHATKRAIIEVLVEKIVVRTLNPEAPASKRKGELIVHYVFPGQSTLSENEGVSVGVICTDTGSSRRPR